MIYFVQAALIGRIKIGYCRRDRLDHRMSGLQTCSPVPLTLLATAGGGREREAALHARFAACRALGEWFDPAPALVRFIARLQGRARTTTPRKLRLKRGATAEEWLRARFQESPVWKAADLFARAFEDGVSRAAIFEAKAQMDLPRARRRAGPDGTLAYFWHAPPAEAKSTGESH